jgi:Fe-S-cluster containining protein
MWKGSAYDCQRCGACCTNPEAVPATGYVALSNHEAKQMRRLGLSVVHNDDRALLGTRNRIETSHPICVALGGQIGAQCSCTIYEQRPGNCRRFEIGSQLCKTAREVFGLWV